MYRSAPQPDIVRSHQKDEYTYNTLRDTYVDVIHGWYGNRFINDYEQEIDLLSNMTYYGITTLMNKKTLGEEYCDLLPVTNKRVQPLQLQASGKQHSTISRDTSTTTNTPTTASTSDDTTTASNTPVINTTPPSSSAATITPSTPPSTNTSVPTTATSSPPSSHKSQPLQIPRLLSREQRIMLVSLYVGLPYIYSKLRKRGRTVQIPRYSDAYVLRADASSNRRIPLLYRKLRHILLKYSIITYNKILQLVLSSDQYLTTFQKLHLALFYLYGDYLEVTKRICSVRYVLVRQLDIERPSYSLLGVLILIQLGVAGIHELYIHGKIRYSEWLERRQLLATGYTVGESDVDSRGNVISVLEEEHPSVVQIVRRVRVQ